MENRKDCSKAVHGEFIPVAHYMAGREAKSVNIQKADLTGRRVLVVEDEVLVSMLVEDMLADIGCIVVGPAPRVDIAVEMASNEEIDAAFLDVNLAGVRVFPVADVLAQRGIPFIFVSGYGDQATIDEPHQGRPIIQKPFVPEALEEALLACLSEAS